ncbi:MAG: cohesin domain-containing protein [Ardenticatenales bacterium]
MAERRAAVRRRAFAACAVCVLSIAVSKRPVGPAFAQAGLDVAGLPTAAYPSPSEGWLGQEGSVAPDRKGQVTPGWPPSFAGYGTSAAPTEGAADAPPPAAASGPVHIAFAPPSLALESGGRAVTVLLRDAAMPLSRIALDLRYNADHFVVTALTADPALTASGAQIDFKHRIEPGRLRLNVALTASDPSLLPSGSVAIVQITFAAITAGSGELALEAATSSVVAADGSMAAIESDGPAMLLANDGAAGPLATQVAAASDALIAQSAPASEMSASSGGVAAMARDIVATLRAAIGGIGMPGGDGDQDGTPLLAWIGVLVGALCVTGLGYLLGRAPAERGPRRTPRRARRGGAVLEHDVIEPERELR